MESSVTYAAICVAALSASALSLLSGFGLGTVLVPAFAIFFPISIAVALAAIVHLLNNLFKLILVGKHADRNTVIWFGIPAIAASLLGAQVLVWLAKQRPLADYQIHGHAFEITVVKLVVAVMMTVFAIMEMLPRMERMSFDRKVFPVGGLLSGFFGGLSGHQGALRSAFLVRSGLSKERFIGTVVVIAVLVDIPRISVYIASFSLAGSRHELNLVLAATLSAFLGALVGTRWIKKTTMGNIQVLVGVMLFIVALALGSGLV
jgi:uncharacterized protein